MQKLLIATSLLFSACYRDNSHYCAGNPDNNCNQTGSNDGGIDGNEAISCVNTGCVGNAAGSVCDTATKACVQCTPGSSGDHSACSGTAPVCKSDACTACTANSDCPDSNTCLPTGACAVATDVAYVDSSVATGGTCGMADPCKTIAVALSGTKSIIRVTGVTTETQGLSLSRNVTIIGEHTTDTTTAAAKQTITSGASYGATVVLTVPAPYILTMVDMAIDGMGTALDGLDSAGTVTLNHCSISNTTRYGLYATSGTVNVHRSLINLNKMAGLLLSSSTFVIDNSFIVHNGNTDAAGAAGGLALSFSTGTLTFSTVAKNISLGTGYGVNCGTGATLNFTNNIVYYNTNAFIGNCAWTYSEIDGTLPSGTGNIGGAPKFLNLTADEFHLDIDSPGANVGSGTLKLDIDAQVRPMGSGPDIGADEVQ